MNFICDGNYNRPIEYTYLIAAVLTALRKERLAFDIRVIYLLSSHLTTLI